MKRLWVCMVIAGFGVGIVGGCSEESKVQQKKTIENPDGKTEITTEKKIEKSGDNPPPANK